MGKRALIACKVDPEDEGDDDQVDDEAIKHSQSVVSLDHLESDKREKLEGVLADYPDLFRLEPGRTKVLEHIIHLTDSNPVRQRPYRVPESLVAPLKKEIQLMRDLGVIESSTSAWSSPIVLVPKKDGSLRLYLDFRRLNSVSKFDAYPMPRSPDFTKRFLVQVDASSKGIGAVLAQGEVGWEQPILYLSRKLLPRETHYSTIGKEGLAIKWALDSLRYYLLGREFDLKTDHRALTWIHTMKDQNSRVTRWYLSLQPFQFKVQYRARRSNVPADFLSRLPSLVSPREGR